MNVAVIGGSGQLGSDVCTAFERNGDSVARLDHSSINVESASSVADALGKCKAEYIVNTAAMHHVEKCEENPELAFAINGVGARNVAAWAQRAGATVAYISTDYVFDGAKTTPYVETDAARPLNVYGITKLDGENFTLASSPRSIVLRVSAIYGQHPCRAKGGLNFVELMLKLARERGKMRVVADEYISPTPTVQIAAQLVELSRSESFGVFHGTTEGSCSWYEFTEEILSASGTKAILEKADPGEFPVKVPRPKYSVLENAALKRAGKSIFTDWRTGLHDYLHDRSHTNQ